MLQDFVIKILSLNLDLLMIYTSLDILTAIVQSVAILGVSSYRNGDIKSSKIALLLCCCLPA